MQKTHSIPKTGKSFLKKHFVNKILQLHIKNYFTFTVYSVGFCHLSDRQSTSFSTMTSQRLTSDCSTGGAGCGGWPEVAGSYAWWRGFRPWGEGRRRTPRDVDSGRCSREWACPVRRCTSRAHTVMTGVGSCRTGAARRGEGCYT